MNKIDYVNIRRLDLTLLLVFEAVMDSGKLTIAGQRLGLTQSAVSHAVKRLRDVLGDDLFVRTPHGVRPTQRALALREPLAEALRLVASALQAPHFDASRDRRIFRIAALDYETALIAPSLAQALPKPSPSQFLFNSLARQDAVDAVKIGRIDLLVGYAWKQDASCNSQVLYQEDYLVVARRRHPHFKAGFDLDRYAALGHVLVSPGGSPTGIVDSVLAKRGKGRRVAVVVPYFLSALAIVAQSDLVATLPRRLVRRYAPLFGLQYKPPPAPVRSFPVSMIWSKSAGADPAARWLREQVADAAARFDR